VVEGSDRVLTFDGKTSINIPPGAPVLSDPVVLRVPALTEVAVSLFIPEESRSDTFHFLAQHPTCVSKSGDLTGQGQWPGAEQKHSWYWLAGVEVLAPAATSAVAALGDSITDGFGATGEYFDWPDLLDARLQSGGKYKFSVINEGIGGNRLLHDGDGPSALARLDRDALSQKSVRNLIVLEGLNDIGWPAMVVPVDAPPGVARQRPFAGQEVTAGEIIQALQQIIGRAHGNGIKVFGCTLTPYRGSFFYTEAGDAVRESVNQWIRTSQSFDGVFDFDKALRDPTQPDRLLPAYQSGDWLHPSNAGYAAMVDAMNPALFSNIRTSDRPAHPHLSGSSLSPARESQ
jgi:lysophospholipase L1-like esterase